MKDDLEYASEGIKELAGVAMLCMLRIELECDRKGIDIKKELAKLDAEMSETRSKLTRNYTEE